MNTPMATRHVTIIDDRNIEVIGYLHAFPRHPARGAEITTLDEPNVPTTGLPLFALVSVHWACEWITVDPANQSRTTEYIEGALGSPRGTTWYLTPAEYDMDAGKFKLGSIPVAAGSHTAHLPDSLVAAMRDRGHDAPKAVKVHDFSIH